MAKDEIVAAGGAVLKTLASRAPLIGEVLAAKDAYRQKQREKAAEEFAQSLSACIDTLGDRFQEKWLSTEEGQMFAAKVVESGLDAQMADKRELFANALANGAASDSDVYEKTKFVDLLRHLSRDALDVLCELHRDYGPIVRKPPASRSESTSLSSERVATELSQRLDWDPYRIESAYRELCAVGLLSRVTHWVRDKNGVARTSGTYDRDETYTAFAERFVDFITSETTTE